MVCFLPPVHSRGGCSRLVTVVQAAAARSHQSAGQRKPEAKGVVHGNRDGRSEKDQGEHGQTES